MTMPLSTSEATGGHPPLPDTATDPELLERVLDSRQFAEMNLSFGETETDASNAVMLLEDALVHARRLRDQSSRQRNVQELESLLASTQTADAVEHTAEEAELAAAIELSLAVGADAEDASDEVLQARASSLLQVAHSHIARDEDGRPRIERNADATEALALLEKAQSYAMRMRRPQAMLQPIIKQKCYVYQAQAESRKREERLDESTATCEQMLSCAYEADDRGLVTEARSKMVDLFILRARRAEAEEQRKKRAACKAEMEGRHQEAAKWREHGREEAAAKREAAVAQELERVAEQIALLRADGALERSMVAVHLRRASKASSSLYRLSGRQLDVTKLVDLAQAYLICCGYKLAADLLRQALEISNATNDRLELLICLCDVTFHQAEDDTRVLPDVVQFGTQMMELQMQHGMGQCSLATLEGTLSSNVLCGRALFWVGDREEGLSRCEEVLQVAGTTHLTSAEADARLAIGNMCASNGQHERAKASFEARLATLRARGDEDAEAATVECLTLLASSCRSLLQHEQVIRHCTQALALLQQYLRETTLDERRLGLAALSAKPSRMLVEALFRTGQEEASLEQAERGRARALDLMMVRQRMKKDGPGSAWSRSTHPDAHQCTTTGFSDGQCLSEMRQHASRHHMAIVTFACVDAPDCKDILAWVVGSSGTLTSCRLSMGDDWSVKPGAEVQLRGLVGRADLNGRRGTIVQAQAGSADCRWEVNVPGESNRLLLKPQNLARPAPPTGAAAKVAGGGSPPETGSLADLVDLTRKWCGPPKWAPGRDLTFHDDEDEPQPAPAAAAPQPAPPAAAPQPEPAAAAVSPASEAPSSPLRRCHQLLIGPLGAALANEPRLLLLPDLELYSLPFAALQGSDGVHLIERHVLTVAPSFGTVLELERRLWQSRRATPSRRSLVVGDPNFRAEDAETHEKQLDHAVLEAKRVHALLESHGRAAVLVTGADATKEAVTGGIRTSDIVHLATHGRPTGVLMADGILSMAELQALRLQSSPLIVLSACNTFGGKLGTDSVVGIARSCLVAGASSVLASLWPVEDAATRKLMEGFYRRLLTGDDMDVAAALQGSMLEMLRRGAHPRQWAPFVCFGLQYASKATYTRILHERVADRKSSA